MGSPTGRANDAAGFALCLCVYRHLSRFDVAYSDKCLEGAFSEVRTGLRLVALSSRKDPAEQGGDQK